MRWSELYDGESASPSNPPSPLVLTPGTCIATCAVPPPRGMRMMLPVVRSETSALPSGRKTRPHGTCSPVTIVFGDVLSGAVVRTVVGFFVDAGFGAADGDGAFVGLAVVVVGDGVRLSVGNGVTEGAAALSSSLPPPHAATTSATAQMDTTRRFVWRADLIPPSCASETPTSG